MFLLFRIFKKFKILPFFNLLNINKKKLYTSIKYKFCLYILFKNLLGAKIKY